MNSLSILEDLLKADPLGFLTQKIMPCTSKHFDFCLPFGSFHALILFLFNWMIFKSLPAIHQMAIFLLQSVDFLPSPVQTPCYPSPHAQIPVEHTHAPAVLSFLTVQSSQAMLPARKQQPASPHVSFENNCKDCKDPDTNCMVSLKLQSAE